MRIKVGSLVRSKHDKSVSGRVASYEYLSNRLRFFLCTKRRILYRVINDYGTSYFTVDDMELVR